VEHFRELRIRFPLSYNHSAPNDANTQAEFQEKVVEPLTGDPDDPRAAALRRLHFEAFTLFAVDMQRNQQTREDDEKPQRLPGPERSARFDEVTEELDGLELELQGPLEPSNALVDKLVAIQNSGELRYIHWEELTRRDQEVKG